MGMMHRNKLQRVAKEATLSTSKTPVVKEETKKTYTKSEITTMSTSDLKELAVSLGIEDAENTSGMKLKPIIIEKLGL